MAKPIQLTDSEREALHSHVITMYTRIMNDKHVDRATKDMWWSILEKVRKAGN